MKTKCPEILKHVGKQYRFLPKEFSTKATIDIFGDHVNITAPMRYGGLEEEFSITVIVNQVIADAFRSWFWYMWRNAG